MTAITDALIGARFLDKGGAIYNVKHPDFGAEGDGVADDGPSWNLTRAAVPANGGVVFVPPGSYLLTTAFTFSSQNNVLLWIMPGVVLTGSALPVASGANAILDWRSEVFNISGPLRLSTVITSSDDATPSVLTGNILKIGGSTTITDFDDGGVGQTIKILATEDITIVDGANILLSGSANFNMLTGDVLVLTMYNDQVWEEDSRKVN